MCDVEGYDTSRAQLFAHHCLGITRSVQKHHARTTARRVRPQPCYGVVAGTAQSGAGKVGRCAQRCAHRERPVQNAMHFYLDVAVDSFLNLDYADALNFYWLFVHARGAQRCPSVAHFLQCTLGFLHEGHSAVASARTLWAARCVGWPALYTAAEVLRIVSRL